MHAARLAVECLDLVGVRAALVAALGAVRAPAHRLEPVAQLIRSVVGARTEDEASWTGFVRLAGAVDRWPDLADLPAKEVERLIEGVTWADSKARQAPLLMRVILSRLGGTDLDFLGAMTVEEARRWLRGLPAVSGDIAAATLNFSRLAAPDFVVDGHVLRALRRLGLVERTATADDAYAAVMGRLPAGWGADDLFELHWLLRALGQSACAPGQPACADCPLSCACPKVEAAATSQLLTFRPRRELAEVRSA